MDYDVSARFNVGGSVVVQSNVYRFGDEAPERGAALS